MSKRSDIEREVRIQELIEANEKKYDNLKAGADVGSILLLVGSVFTGAFIATPLSITLGVLGFCLFGSLNIASKFLIEKKKTETSREIAASAKSEKLEREKPSSEQILENDKATSEQLDLMHQFEVEEAERREREVDDTYNPYDHLDTYEGRRLEMLRYESESPFSGRFRDREK